jgi:hypothetical protein
MAVMLRGEYGKSLLRRRGELVERSFAHCYETGAMRRCHLRGHAAGVEEPLRQAGLDPSLTFHVLDKSKAALQKPNLCIRCQAHREIAYPTASPDRHEIRYLHPGLLGRRDTPALKSSPQGMRSQSRLVIICANS